MNRHVQLRTPLSGLGGNADAYLAHYEKIVVDAVGYDAAMRIAPSGGASPFVEVELWVPDDEDGVNVTKEAISRASGAGFFTEVVVIPASLF